ncbi:MAG TPA: ABC transporter permease subunit, partial [Nitrococcus sp.]|nr:ABC transporter permease subunit [Nitrococcus sp.]
MGKQRLALAWRPHPVLTMGDLFVLMAIAAVLYGGIHIALGTPAVVRGPQISLAPSALPWYTFLSVARMWAAYALSLAFSIVYGYTAARSRSAQRVLMPLLDVLQSVPILSFLPIVLLGASAFLPAGVAAELAAIVLIFTSQAWNLTFSFYQSVSTVPREMDEAARIFRLGFWLR